MAAGTAPVLAPFAAGAPLVPSRTSLARPEGGQDEPPSKRHKKKSKSKGNRRPKAKAEGGMYLQPHRVAV